MFFFLPFATCLAVTALVRRAARDGKVARLTITPAEHPLLRHLPRSMFRRAALVGSACAGAVAPLAIGVLVLCGVRELSLDAAVGLKGVLAAALAALTTPVSALYALAHEEDPMGALPGPG